MLFRTGFQELNIIISMKALFAWLLISLVSSQNKGDRFYSLQTGEHFQLMLGNWGSTDPVPGYFMVGGWFKWNRCSYASTKASPSDPAFLEATPQRNWLPVHLSQYDDAEARVFDCSK